MKRLTKALSILLIVSMFVLNTGCSLFEKGTVYKYDEPEIVEGLELTRAVYTEDTLRLYHNGSIDDSFRVYSNDGAPDRLLEYVINNRYIEVTSENIEELNSLMLENEYYMYRIRYLDSNQYAVLGFEDVVCAGLIELECDTSAYYTDEEIAAQEEYRQREQERFDEAWAIVEGTYESCDGDIISINYNAYGTPCYSGNLIVSIWAGDDNTYTFHCYAGHHEYYPSITMSEDGSYITWLEGGEFVNYYRITEGEDADESNDESIENQGNTRPTSTDTLSGEITDKDFITFSENWIDYVEEHYEEMSIDNDLIFGAVTLAEMTDGNACVAVYNRAGIDPSEIYTGAEIVVDSETYTVGEPFISDVTHYNQTYHIEGRVIEGRTSFDEDGNIILVDSYYQASSWLEFDSEHNVWVITSFIPQNGVGFITTSEICGYVNLPISSECEIYYNRMVEEYIFDNNCESMVDSYGSDTQNLGDDNYGARFIPANGNANAFQDFVNYVMEFDSFWFTDLVWEFINSELDYNFPYGTCRDCLFQPSVAFIDVENGEITKVYFAWKSCGSYHGYDAELVLGTQGTGDFYYDNM